MYEIIFFFTTSHVRILQKPLVIYQIKYRFFGLQLKSQFGMISNREPSCPFIALVVITV